MEKNQEFKKVYESHVSEIYRFCMFKLNNREESEDVTSETFIKLYEQNISEINNVRAWLYKVARNTIYDNFIRPTTKNLVEFTDMETNEEKIMNSLKSLEKEAIDQATVQIIQSEIEGLDDVTADIITMKIWGEMKFSEIAGATDLKENAVKMRFYRGIDEVKSRVKSKDQTLRSLTIPAVMAGILALSTQPAYAMTATQGAAISAAVGSTLGVTLSTMIGSSVTGLSAGAAAQAGSAVGATAASAAGGLPAVASAQAGGLLATTTAKVIAGSSILLASAGIGIGAVAVSNDPVPQDNPPFIYQDEDPSSDCIVSYTDEDFPNFSFEYDSCEFELTSNKQFSDSEFAGEAASLVPLFIKEINLINDDSSQITFKAYAGSNEYRVYTLAYPECVNEDYKSISENVVRFDNYYVFGSVEEHNYVEGDSWGHPQGNYKYCYLFPDRSFEVDLAEGYRSNGPSNQEITYANITIDFSNFTDEFDQIVKSIEIDTDKIDITSKIADEISELYAWEEISEGTYQFWEGEELIGYSFQMKIPDNPPREELYNTLKKVIDKYNFVVISDISSISYSGSYLINNEGIQLSVGESNDPATSQGATYIIRVSSEASSYSMNSDISLNESYSIELDSVDSRFEVNLAQGITSISHSLDYSHTNVCDFKGGPNGPEQLDTFTDFAVTIQHDPRSIREIFQNEYTYYYEKDFILEDGRIDVANTHFEEALFDNLTGYKSMEGVEGCGHYLYIFPVAEGTIVVKRKIITELNFLQQFAIDEYLSIPGVITPEEEEGLFNDIMNGVYRVNVR